MGDPTPQIQGFHPAPDLEPYPGFRDDQARLRARRDAITAASVADPLPGPLAAAFIPPQPQPVAGLQVRPLVHYDFVILKQLDSPLLKQLQAAGSDAAASTPFSEVEAYEMILLLTTPPRDAAKLAAQGPRAFREAALERIGFRLGPVEVALLVKHVEAEFVRSFSTAIGYGPSASTDSDGTVTFPPPPPTMTTASAGGSITSVASSPVTQPSPATSSSSSSPASKAAPGSTASSNRIPSPPPNASPTAT